jgi:predicted peroxiredoxin
MSSATSSSPQRVVVNLVTGHEDADRVTLAFLVATAACERGRPVAIFATKEAVRLGIEGYGQAVESAGAPPVGRLLDQFVEGGGELLLCPICFNARRLDAESLIPGARLAGASALWDWIGPQSATVFSY